MSNIVFNCCKQVQAILLLTGIVFLIESLNGIYKCKMLHLGISRRRRRERQRQRTVMMTIMTTSLAIQTAEGPLYLVMSTAVESQLWWQWLGQNQFCEKEKLVIKSSYSGVTGMEGFPVSLMITYFPFLFLSQFLSLDQCGILLIR